MRGGTLVVRDIRSICGGTSECGCTFVAVHCPARSGLGCGLLQASLTAVLWQDVLMFGRRADPGGKWCLFDVEVVHTAGHGTVALAVAWQSASRYLSVLCCVATPLHQRTPVCAGMQEGVSCLRWCYLACCRL